MTQIDRRRLLVTAAVSMALPSALARAWAIDARVRTGTLKDVEHVVILMQENRSFDHYFGTMNGVRGFGDRFPIPLADGRTVWSQGYSKGEPSRIAPFHLNTRLSFDLMRTEGTPHSWADAQNAWNEGRLSAWPDHKRPHSMGHFSKADLPFQRAMADAFTLCDAYHCSFQGGTNTNRLFLWTGTNDGAGTRGGPSISNSHDRLPEKGGAASDYLWTTYPERLEAAGVSWKIYEDMADNFGDNPLVGFKAFRDSLHGAPGSNPALARKGLSTQHLDALRADVAVGALPQVSWVISPAKDSEHPDPSSPAQGADYVARVLDCLTSNPEVWAKTVFLVMYDENDGYFDHVSPPAPPSLDAAGRPLGGSTADTAGEYHRVQAPSEKTSERESLFGRPYGLGPRVPMFVVSPWSRGGWVNSEVFDHTSVIRFCEARFGVMEPNISAWRRAVCGDLTSCFDFSTPNASVAALPETASTAARAAALPKRTQPPIPDEAVAPTQAMGTRPSRALGYRLACDMVPGSAAHLRLSNSGRLGAVIHVHDRMRPDAPPRRYTLEPGKALEDHWPEGSHDLVAIGPDGFCRIFTGTPSPEDVAVTLDGDGRRLRLTLVNGGRSPRVVTVSPAAHGERMKSWRVRLAADAIATHAWNVSQTGGWYDLVATSAGDDAWRRRLAGRVATGSTSTSDPAMGGAAVIHWS